MAQIELRGEIRKNQREGETIGEWVRSVVDKRLPRSNTYFTKENIIMKKKFDSFTVVRGVLFREILEKDQTILQLVLPHCYRQTILQGLHNDTGYPGRDRTLSLIRERVFGQI